MLKEGAKNAQKKRGTGGRASIQLSLSFSYYETHCEYEKLL